MASRILIVVCALAILATPAAPLPYPGANDAGTGTDAGDYQQVATPVEAGRHDAEVGWDIRTPVAAYEYDWQDFYVFDPPANSSVRVTVEVPGPLADDDTLLIVDVEGPDGGDVAILSGTEPGGPAWNRSTMNFSSVRDGPWYLSVTDYYQPGPQPYRFEIAYRQFDHGTVLDGEGAPAAAWEVDFPQGVPGRIDASLFHPRPPDRARGDVLLLGAWFHRSESHGCGDAWVVPAPWLGSETTGRNGLDGEDVIWTEGLPEDVEVGAPLGKGPLPDTRHHGIRLPLGLPDGNGTVRWAYADLDGVGAVGAVLWDGPGAPSIRKVRAEAEFLTVQDFEAGEGGLGVQVGPAAYAQDMEAEVSVPGDLEANAVYVNAMRQREHRPAPFVGEVPLSTAAPTMDVQIPNGTTRTLRDTVFTWIPLDVPSSAEPYFDEDVPSGTWRVHLDRVDGLEGDEVRVMRAGFGFPFECPE